MKATTKLIALGTAGALGAAAYGATRMLRRRRPKPTTDVDAELDASDVSDISEITDTDDINDTDDIEEPIVVEEVVVITGPYEVDIELIPSDDPRVRRS